MTAFADLVLAHWLDGPKREQYRRDPAFWASEKLGAFLWSKQRDICRSVIENRRTAVRSGHGIGKSWTAGMLAAWWIDTHPIGEAIVITTAPTYDQVHAILWEEIRKQHRLGTLKGDVLQNDRWNIDGILVGQGRKPADYDDNAFQGIHRRYVLVILDEACGIPESLWTGAEAITTNADCRIVAIGNPDNPASEFFEACKPGSGWNVIGVSSYDSPNLTGETVPGHLPPLLVDADWIEGRRKKWGADSPLFISKVLGEFPEVGENTLIPIRHIIAAQERTLEPLGLNRLGVDVARFGSDRSVIGHRLGSVYRMVSDRAGDSTMETTGRVIRQYQDTRAHQIQVDGVGVGGGVVDSLAEQGFPVIDLQSGTAAQDSERFLNARAEWYWGLRERFEQGDMDIDPEDDELASQLSSIRYKYTSRGQLQIESKDDMRKRGMPSPDKADTCMMTFAVPPEDYFETGTSGQVPLH